MNRIKFICVLVAVLAMLVVAGANATLAQVGNDLQLFELDRNAIDDGNVTGDDWNTLYNDGGSALAYTFVADKRNSKTDDIFTTGGSKDVNDITQWQWTEGTVLDKDDIANAYAAAYIANDQHVIVFFGLDRYANNGDAMTGFWFLQNPVTIVAGTFSPSHQEGDILVLAHFTGGGAIVSIEVLAWNSTAPDHLTLLTTSAGADVFEEPDVFESINAGGTVNNQTEEAPWPYTTKFPDTKKGDVHDFATGTFFEGGIDLTALLPPETPVCFTTFLAETRSSASYDAQLKDLAMGEFDLCACLTVTKVIEWGDMIGTAADWYVADFPVHVTGPYGFSANVTFHLEDNVLYVGGNATDSVTFTGLRQGNYTVTETPLPAGWETPAFDPSGTVSVNTANCTEVTVTNTPTPGCLNVTKEVNYSGADSSKISETFTVKVTGPSYPGPAGTTHNFVVTNGVLSGSPWILDNLIPGNYTITEQDAGDEWTETVPAGNVTVNPGTTCATATVTNTYRPGCLNVTKAIDMNGLIGGDLADLADAEFSINVTGPSYPASEGGLNVVFYFTDGVLTGPEGGNSTCICDLIPGDYYVTEAALPGWEAANITGSPATVAAGDACGNATVVTVTNTPKSGCLLVVKDIDTTGVIGTPADGEFIVNVFGPSYPAASGGHDLTFNLTDGSLYVYNGSAWVAGDSYCLCKLIPGEYAANETSMPTNWQLDGYSPSPTVSVSAGAECSAVNITVTDKYNPADVQVVKTGTISYTIIVSNNSTTTAAENVNVSDVLPGLLNWNISSSSGFTTISIDGCSHLMGTIAFLDAGESASVTVAATIDGHSANPLLGNYVTVMTITPESNTDNNIDDADIAQRPPCL